MQEREQPTNQTAPEIGQYVLNSVDRFLEQYPRGDQKNWDDLQSRLFRWIGGVDPGVAFHGLMWILETQTRYQYQQVAGELLDRGSLKSHVPLSELLDKIVPTFNLSAKAIPKYLAHSFGRDAVVKRLQEIRHTARIDEHKVSGMLYWLEETAP